MDPDGSIGKYFLIKQCFGILSAIKMKAPDDFSFLSFCLEHVNLSLNFTCKSKCNISSIIQFF